MYVLVVDSTPFFVPIFSHDDSMLAPHSVAILSLDETRVREKMTAIEASRNEEVQAHQEKVRRTILFVCHSVTILSSDLTECALYISPIRPVLHPNSMWRRGVPDVAR